MSQLCEKGLDLIKELIRSQGFLQPLREDAVRQILEEMKVLFHENQKDVELSATSEVQLHTTVHVRHVALMQMKRCVLAYLYHRLQQIKDMRWAFGSVLAPEVKMNMSDQEQQWFNNYSRILGNFMATIGGGIDLMKHMHPPKSLYIQVRCLCDYGDFETEDGMSVVLSKNSTHFLERSQCEKLIHQGILEHITS